MSLDNRIKELIAVGASISANCQPCLEYHIGKAREYGAEESDITEAIAVGTMVRKGAANKMDKFALELQKTTTAEIKPTDSNCCGSNN